MRNLGLSRFALALLCAAFIVTARAESPDGATSELPITDNAGVVWSLSSTGKVLRNGAAKYAWTGKLLVWSAHSLYLQGNSGTWYALNRSNGAAFATTDPRIVVQPAPSPTPTPVPVPTSGGPVVTLDATIVAAGQPIVAHLRNAVAGSTKDWISLAPVGAAPQVFLAWKYIGDGATSFDFTAPAPLVAGNYEVRLFTRDGFVLAAKSPSVTVPTTVVPELPMIGPSNTPDILNLEMIDEATVRAASTQMAEPWAFAPQFRVDPNGVKYLQFSSAAATRLISWYLPFTAREEAYFGYAFYIGSDVAAGMNELGVKLPGLGSNDGVISWRMLHERVGSNGTFPLVDYRYSADSGAGFGMNDPITATLVPGRWYWIEQHARLNTPGVADGFAEVFLNGRKVWGATNIRWRDVASTLFDHAHVNVYHGGMTIPFADITYRVAKFRISASYIGVPVELSGAPVTTSGAPAATIPPAVIIPTAPPLPTVGAFPAWRTAITVKDKFAAIPNSALYPLGSMNRVDFYNGFGASDDAWYAVAAGGHNTSNGTNPTYRFPFFDADPRWALDHAGSPASVIPTMTEMDATHPRYYSDGLRPGSQTYYLTQYLSAAHAPDGLARMLSITLNSPYSGNGGLTMQVDGYQLAAKKWDKGGPEPGGPGVGGVWNDKPYLYSNTVVMTVARDPRTGKIYVGDNIYFWIFDPTVAGGKWTQIWLNGPGLGAMGWAYHGSVIDTKRNRWAYMDVNSQIEFIDLATLTHSILPVTGMTSEVGAYTGLVHDLDGDRYLLASGGEIWQINPTSGAALLLTTVPASDHGPLSRFAYFPKLGGVAYMQKSDTDVLFLPTR